MGRNKAFLNSVKCSYVIDVILISSTLRPFLLVHLSGAYFGPSSDCVFTKGLQRYERRPPGVKTGVQKQNYWKFKCIGVCSLLSTENSNTINGGTFIKISESLSVRGIPLLFKELLVY